MSFIKFDIDENICNALKKIGINTPTNIQNIAIPHIKSGKNIIAQANTGTGKTLSFIIPILDKLLKRETDRILILAPTRELVLQISNEANRLVDQINALSDIDISVLPIYGGKDIKSQINKLKNNINIVVATPGRLLDHLNRKTIDIKSTDIFVLDEADQMLLMGFKNEIDLIFSKIEKVEQILLFSATIDPKVKKLAYKYASDLMIISDKEETSIPQKIQQEFVITTDRKKFDDFCEIIDRDRPFMAIIFCRTKSRVDNLDLKLSQKGYSCEKIHSDISQSKREKIMKDFRNIKIQFLISTDLSSRGLDIEGVTHIYNYDFPENTEDYIHRIGRTGRIGKEGKACSFITDKNVDVYEDLKKLFQIS